jgi:proteasome lid subunit RPN8/RPN11
LKNCPKLIIPQKISNKIKFLCGKISSVEWSGVLFYSVKGSIKQFDKVEFVVEDIYLMNQGTKAYTEYELDDDLIDYRMSNPQSLAWKIGLIHSHNSMKSYFSGTDMSELNDNSEFHNYYLSLIVNNFGEMVAKIAFRGDIKNYQCKDEKGENWDLSLLKAKQVMFTFDCEIIEEEIVPFVEESFSERLKEILKKAELKSMKEEEKNKIKTLNTNSNSTSDFQNKNFTPHSSKQNDEWFTDRSGLSENFDIPPISKMSNKSLKKISHEEKISMFTAYVLKLGDDNPDASDDVDFILAGLEAVKINIFEYTSRVLTMYPALFEKFWDEFGDIDGDFFRLVTEDVLEILEQSFDEYELVEHLLSGFNIMLNRMTIL